MNWLCWLKFQEQARQSVELQAIQAGEVMLFISIYGQVTASTAFTAIASMERIKWINLDHQKEDS